MEEAMSHTAAHSRYGTDDRVKLPNLTDEEVNWQGLEDLYSMNESLYECRPDYGPSHDNWVNFQKDVDNMFALRHVLDTLNRTLDDDSTLPELGSGAGGGGGSEEGSGEGESASASDAWLPTPAPSRTPSAPPEESALNDLPERLPNRPVTSPVMSSPSPSGPRRGAAWAQQLEEMEGEMFSGNGLTELETRHDNLLRSHNGLRARLEPDPGQGEAPGPRGLDLDLEEEEDIFQAQGYLPFSPQTARPTVRVGVTGSPPTTQTSAPQSVGVVLQALSLDYEGSGSQPQPSNQTL